MGNGVRFFISFRMAGGQALKKDDGRRAYKVLSEATLATGQPAQWVVER